jgi:tRNA pseudouridine55 synthase
MTAATPKPRRFDRDVEGVLLLDKPIGVTSNAALQQVRVLFRALKAGHAGSLDPMASGMLPICFGQATKICSFLLDASKTYRFTARLGERTDTGDADGTIVAKMPIPELSEAQIKTTLHSHLGEQQQVPPMYSALKHQGQRLYELARRGEEVERAPRRIVIESLELLRFAGDELEVNVRCSKGTYVRVLAEDIASRLGTVGHLIALRRLQVDPFEERSMRTIEQLTMLANEGFPKLDGQLLATDQALLHLAAAEFDEAGQDALLHGQSASGRVPDKPTEWMRMYGPHGVFLGLGEAIGASAVQPRRIFRHLPIKP